MECLNHFYDYQEKVIPFSIMGILSLKEHRCQVHADFDHGLVDHCQVIVLELESLPGGKIDLVKGCQVPVQSVVEVRSYKKIVALLPKKRQIVAKGMLRFIPQGKKLFTQVQLSSSLSSSDLASLDSNMSDRGQCSSHQD